VKVYGAVVTVARRVAPSRKSTLVTGVVSEPPAAVAARVSVAGARHLRLVDFTNLL